MTLLDGINHIATVTEDIDRFVAFYERVFDAHVFGDMEEEGLRHAFIRIGGSTVLHPFQLDGLTLDEQPPMFRRGRLDHYGINARSYDDLLEIRRRLLAEGASDGVLRDFGPMYSVSFVDPDGTELEVNVLKADWEDIEILKRVDWLYPAVDA